MDRLLRFFLQTFVRRGSLHVMLANNTTFNCGDGTGPALRIRFTTKAAQRHMVLDPDMAFGECYMNGTLIIENATIAELLELVLGQPVKNAGPREIPTRYAVLLGCLFFGLIRTAHHQGQCKQGGSDTNKLREPHEDSFLGGANTPVRHLYKNWKHET